MKKRYYMPAMEICGSEVSQIIASSSFKGGGEGINIDPTPDDGEEQNRVKGDWEIEWNK